MGTTDQSGSEAKGPAWLEEAIQLRRQGYTLREIAQRVGRTAQRVQQVLGKLGVDGDPELIAARRVAAGKLVRCQRCGRPTSSKQGICGRCRPAVVAETKARRKQEVEARRERRYRRLEELWAAGKAASEIAQELGVGEAYVHQLIIRGRRQGYRFPYRRPYAAPKGRNL
jgi:transposase